MGLLTLLASSGERLCKGTVSVRLSFVCPSICLSRYSIVAATCSWFAAELERGRRIDRLLSTVCRRTHSGQRHVEGGAENASTGKHKYGKGKYETVHFARMENASTENASTNLQRWKTQVRKMQVQCNSHSLFSSCLKRNVTQRKNKISSVSCLIVKPHSSRYCTATHGTVGIGGD